jgi:hypothetical protein
MRNYEEIWAELPPEIRYLPVRILCKKEKNPDIRCKRLA